MQNLVNYAYTSQIEIRKDNVQVSAVLTIYLLIGHYDQSDREIHQLTHEGLVFKENLGDTVFRGKSRF